MLYPRSLPRWIASRRVKTSHNGTKAFYDDLASEVIADIYAAKTDWHDHNIVLIPEAFCGVGDICVVRNNDFQKSLRAMYLAVSKSPETLYLGPPFGAAPFTNVTNERRYMINHMLLLVTEKEQLKWLATCGPIAGPTAEELALADFERTWRSQENEKLMPKSRLSSFPSGPRALCTRGDDKTLDELPLAYQKRGLLSRNAADRNKTLRSASVEDDVD